MLLLNCRFLSILVYCNGASVELLILSLPIFNSLNTKLFSVFLSTKLHSSDIVITENKSFISKLKINGSKIKP